MVEWSTLAAFALVSLGMVCSPGPNMIYLISRTITQGRRDGFISLLGVITGFLFYVIATMLGLSLLFVWVPVMYDIIRWVGVLYLLWLAWKAVRPGAHSIGTPQKLTMESPKKLYIMGFMTNLLNPKIAILYVSLLPQFMDPARGSLFTQTAILGSTQILVSFIVNLLIVVFAAQLSEWIGKKPFMVNIQNWVMATVLGTLALNLAFQEKK
ncbi:LysE family translocator [Aureibacillus halotolerans]|uniref:Threonine/homoserine/homoserine lactone efflux protein n=1 Tax=Aureibacillus halotolerans TaxID=1508390 RepID=A0A4R6TT17_9BACI|nr:LysE family translocator [Aureibacillus halotolerans]TDQ33721.1 threonine/homoserine/homoserine lactone efflux protein [Aureibacillus halotolerans]